MAACVLLGRPESRSRRPPRKSWRCPSGPDRGCLGRPMMRADSRHSSVSALLAGTCLLVPFLAVASASADWAAAKKGCEGGRAVGCREAGLCYENGQGVEKNLGTAPPSYP